MFFNLICVDIIWFFFKFACAILLNFVYIMKDSFFHDQVVTLLIIMHYYLFWNVTFLHIVIFFWMLRWMSMLITIFSNIYKNCCTEMYSILLLLLLYLTHSSVWSPYLNYITQLWEASIHQWMKKGWWW